MTQLALLGAPGFTWDEGALPEANSLLLPHHYLGPVAKGVLVFVGRLDGEAVAAQVWDLPRSRRLPSDGSWLELTRWCLTPAAGANAGSRMHAFVVRRLKRRGGITTLVSYSDPSQGHTGALYRACNWHWAPTWHRLRPPPSGNGQWSPGSRREAVKDRWVFELARDGRRPGLLCVRDGVGAGHDLRYGWSA